jgi:hypothetical protein
MFQEKLKQYVSDNPNLVSLKPAGENMFVLKYRKKVFYDGLWDDFLEHCRGTIVDRDFNIVTYPFQKIYNYGIEREAPILPPDTQVTAYRKVNGFMVAVTWYNGDLLVSTTGSTDSDYVAMARELIAPNLEKFRQTCEDYSGYTFMFECVHRNDPHVVPEVEGMYYLGHRQKIWGGPVSVSPGLHLSFGCFGVERIRCTIAELQVMTKECRHEGFVFYTDDGVSAKIKSPYYLTSKWVARNPRTDKLVDLKKDIKHQIDEEYYGLIDAIRANIVEYTALDEQARLSWVRNYLGE